MNQTQYDAMLGYMRSCVGDPAHAEDHVMRVTNAAMDIAADEPNVNREALLCACLLHDIGRPEQVRDPSLHHAAVGAEKARAYLMQNGWEANFADFVADIISAHSSAAMAGARGIEARILFDADKLDVIGAIGAFRAIAYALEVGEPLYDRLDFSDSPLRGGSTMREIKNDLTSALSSFMTRRGKALAEEKARLSRAFLAALREEMRFGEHFPSLTEIEA